MDLCCQTAANDNSHIGLPQIGMHRRVVRSRSRDEMFLPGRPVQCRERDESVSECEECDAEEIVPVAGGVELVEGQDLLPLGEGAPQGSVRSGHELSGRAIERESAELVSRRERRHEPQGADVVEPAQPRRHRQTEDADLDGEESEERVGDGHADARLEDQRAEEDAEGFAGCAHGREDGGGKGEAHTRHKVRQREREYEHALVIPRSSTSRSLAARDARLAV